MTRTGSPTLNQIMRGAALFALAASYASSAQAQSDVRMPPSSESRDEQNEIVVTALHRDTKLQETPLAITATTGKTLRDAGITNIADFAKFVPSLRIQDNGPGQRRAILRGIFAPGEPTVGTYYDDTAIMGSVGTASDAGGRTADYTLFDVNRIEVLRGPQGTLYGASSMGGAIRIIYNKPSQEYEGAVEAQATTTKGGGFSYFVNGMVNVPLIKDLLSVRAVLYRRDGDGYVDNSFLGKRNINDYTATGGRLSARLTPADNFTIDASAMFEDTDAITQGWNPTLGRYISADQTLSPNKVKSQLYNLTSKWEAGSVTLTSITSFQHREGIDGSDDSYFYGTYLTPARCATFVNGSATLPCSSAQLSTYYDYVGTLIPSVIVRPDNSNDFTQEVRLNSETDSWFQWTVGAYYENRRNQIASQDVRADEATGEIIRPFSIFFRRQISDRLKQKAVFVEFSAAPTEKLTLTYGIRYFDYDKIVSGFTDIPLPLIGAGARPLMTVDSSENGTLHKFNVSYQANDDMLFYASATQGFRPGGANQVVGLPDALTAYEADRLWNYEMGTKLSLLDRKLTLNIAAFEIDWDNIQVRGRTPDGIFAFLSNAGEARIRGIEFEAFARPLSGLQFNASFNYLDAKLTEDQVNSNIVGAGRKGDRIPYIPRWSGAAGIEYRGELSPSAEVFARMDANYVGSSFSELRPTNAFRVKMDDYVLTNLRVGVEFDEGDTGLYLFVNNLFDTVAINRASNNSTPNGYFATSSAPRTIGVNMRRNF